MIKNGNHIFSLEHIACSFFIFFDQNKWKFHPEFLRTWLSSFQRFMYADIIFGCASVWILFVSFFVRLTPHRTMPRIFSITCSMKWQYQTDSKFNILLFVLFTVFDNIYRSYQHSAFREYLIKTKYRSIKKAYIQSVYYYLHFHTCWTFVVLL